MAWTDLTFASGSLLTSEKMTYLDENLDALAAGSSGAPKIQTAALADGSVAASKLGTGASYNADQTRYLSITPSDFIPSTRTDGSSINDYGLSDDALYILNPSGSGYFYAPLHLPHGAFLYNLKMYIYRHAGSCTLFLYETDHETNKTSLKLLIINAGTGNVTTNGNVSSTVDNTLYMYSLYLTITNVSNQYDIKMQGILLSYLVTLPLP
jgi:hypothetical protein